jgi:hypothetical protein
MKIKTKVNQVDLESSPQSWLLDPTGLWVCWVTKRFERSSTILTFWRVNSSEARWGPHGVRRQPPAGHPALLGAGRHAGRDGQEPGGSGWLPAACGGLSVGSVLLASFAGCVTSVTFLRRVSSCLLFFVIN